MRGVTLSFDALADLLRVRIPADLEIVRTRSSSTVLRREAAAGRVRLRVHEIFQEAPEAVLEAVATWASRATKKSCATIDAYVREKADRLRAAHRPRTKRLDPRGTHRDLEAVRAALNWRYFDPPVTCPIGFGRVARPRRRRRRSMQYGVFDPARGVIRIHPVLDLPWVDDLFVRLIVFHEMLHAVVPATLDGHGRRILHGAEFRRRERTFEGHARAIAWERRHRKRLLAAEAKTAVAPGEGPAPAEPGPRAGASAPDAARQLPLPFGETGDAAAGDP